ncbi:hypothetical protein FWG86_02245 [Candidatus Saccharibacteria bacterium]|nr:hypothetical protein [Candidatus Saccharibacteria bacterium]
MKARSIKRGIRRVLGVRTWMLVVVWVVIFPVMLIALRVDNLRMESLRNEVMAADEAGDKAEIDAALNRLLRFSSRHMNANTGVFYLQHSYNRAVEEAAGAADETNVYREASDYCERLFNNRWSFAFVECMVERIGAHPAGSAISFPDPALFRYEFISPAFSFSAAGVVAALWFGLALLIVIRLLYYIILRVSLVIIKKKQ